jgi:hypothetical protein
VMLHKPAGMGGIVNLLCVASDARPDGRASGDLPSGRP